MRTLRPRRNLVRVTIAVMLTGVLGALPSSAGSANSAPLPWVEGQVLLALFPSLPDTSWIDRAIDDPFTVLEQVAPLNDFVRVCGPRTGIGAMKVLQFEDEAAAAAATPRLAAMPGVKFAQRNHRVTPTGHTSPSPGGDPATDPRFAEQWALENTGQIAGQFPPKAGTPGQDIRVKPAWAQGTTGEGQVIAILDEGLSINHPDLADNIWTNDGEIAGNDIDDDGNGWVDDVHGWNYVQGNPHPRVGRHGTNVAGIAAASGGNGLGGSGVAPGAMLMPVDWIGDDPATLSGLNAMGAFAYAVANGATVINNSWGFVAPVGIGSPSMRAAVECARQADIVISWSSGNLFAVPQSWPAYYPADNVLVVSSFDNAGCPDLITHQDPALVDLIAPGVNVLTTGGSESYGEFSGSSAAAPHVAGVAALVRSAYPHLNAAEVAHALRAGSRRDFIEPWTRSLGYLSAQGALAAAASGAILPVDSGTDLDSSSIMRCHVRPDLDLIDQVIPAYLNLGPAFVDAFVPGGWPSEAPRPGNLWPGLPRP